MSSPAASPDIQFDRCVCKETKPEGVHLSILAWFQVISILVAGLYFIINHDATNATKISDQQQAIDSVNKKLDSLDDKTNKNTEELAKISGKIDLIVAHRSQGR